MESLKVDLFSDQVFVFTPKGEIKELPVGATPIDFAYEVHTEIGERCIGAKVNGKMVPLKYKLKSGDVVEIITSSKAHPSQDWLKFVKTSRAKAKIRQYLRKVIKEKRKEEQQTTQEIPRRQIPSLRKTHDLTSGISINGLKGMMVRFAKCCNPIPGDEVIGYVTQGRGVSIHCKDCPNIQHLNSSPKIMEISWEGEEGIPCEVGISVYAYDRVGLLQDMLAAISSTKTIINAASAKATKDGMATCSFTVVVHSKEQLNEIINMLQDVSGVIWASRQKASGG
jgi:GTP pyrophosphokinase